MTKIAYFMFLLPLVLLGAMAVSDLSISVQHASVSPGNDGSIDLTLNGGYGPFLFEWVGPNGYTASTEDISNLTPGQYCIIVTDALCGTADLCVTVELDCFDEINLILTTTEGNICPNENNGSLSFDLIGGIAQPYSIITDGGNYAFDNAEATFFWSDLSSGNHCLTITDGCANSYSGCFDIPTTCPNAYIADVSNFDICIVEENGEVRTMGGARSH